MPEFDNDLYERAAYSVYERAAYSTEVAKAQKRASTAIANLLEAKARNANEIADLELEAGRAAIAVAKARRAYDVYMYTVYATEDVDATIKQADMAMAKVFEAEAANAGVDEIADLESEAGRAVAAVVKTRHAAIALSNARFFMR